MEVSFFLNSFTILNVFFRFIPDFIALKLDLWMVGPSAIGSEKGIPISIISAPDFGKASIIFWDVFKSGSPDVTKHIRAFPF